MRFSCALCVITFIWVKAAFNAVRSPHRELMHIFPSVERFFALGDCWVPALTCRHLENKEPYPSNSQAIGSTALMPIKIKKKGGPSPQRGKAPTTPVRTHLGAFKNSSQDPSHRGTANYCVPSWERGKRIWRGLGKKKHLTFSELECWCRFLMVKWKFGYWLSWILLVYCCQKEYKKSNPEVVGLFVGAFLTLPNFAWDLLQLEMSMCKCQSGMEEAWWQKVLKASQFCC